MSNFLLNLAKRSVGQPAMVQARPHLMPAFRPPAPAMGLGVMPQPSSYPVASYAANNAFDNPRVEARMPLPSSQNIVDISIQNRPTIMFTEASESDMLLPIPSSVAETVTQPILQKLDVVPSAEVTPIAHTPTVFQQEVPSHEQGTPPEISPSSWPILSQNNLNLARYEAQPVSQNLDIVSSAEVTPIAHTSTVSRQEAPSHEKGASPEISPSIRPILSQNNLNLARYEAQVGLNIAQDAQPRERIQGRVEPLPLQPPLLQGLITLSPIQVQVQHSNTAREQQPSTIKPHKGVQPALAEQQLLKRHQLSTRQAEASAQMESQVQHTSRPSPLVQPPLVESISLSPVADIVQTSQSPSLPRIPRSLPQQREGTPNIEVQIGTIDLHIGPATPPASASQHHHQTQGFNAYRRLRTYSGWEG